MLERLAAGLVPRPPQGPAWPMALKRPGVQVLLAVHRCTASEAAGHENETKTRCA